MPFCEIRNVLSCGVNYIIFKLLQYILPYFIIVRLSVYSNYVYIPTTVYIKCILSVYYRNLHEMYLFMGWGGWYRLIYPTAAYITIGYHLMPAAYYRVPGLAQLPHEWL